MFRISVHKVLHISLAALFVFALAFGASGVQIAHAASLTVNTTANDMTPGDGFCTLSEALNNANYDIENSGGDCTAGSGDDMITFSVSGTITATGLLSSIVSNVTIDGTGQNITISGGGATRLFFVNLGGGLTLQNLTISDGNSVDGGAIFILSGALSVINSTISGNTTSTNGGAIYNLNGGLSVTNSTLSGNSAVLGGGIYNDGGYVTVTDSTFSGNRATNSGNGVYNNGGTVTITNSTFDGNRTTNGDGDGGGIWNSGMLNVTGSTFSRNLPAFDGGGIFNSGTGTLMVTDSTFFSNEAGEGSGGGIFNQGMLTVTNSTFSANNADGGRGGGIYNSGTLTAINNTFSDNIAFDDNGKGIHNSGAATLKNTIIARSVSGFSEENCSGAIIDGGGNLSWPDTSCPGANADPKLIALADNGGPTQTMALDTGSAAIDAGNDATCVAAVGAPDYGAGGKDQRGVTRPVDGDATPGAVCDIGAYEANAQSGPNLVVNDSADTDDGSCDVLVAGFANCTLREAINAANAQSGANTITFDIPASDSGCSAANVCTVTLGATLPSISDADGLTIDGSGADVTISGNNVAPVMRVHISAALNLNALTIADGNNTCANVPPACTPVGGGIVNQGTLTVTDSTFSNNSAGFGGGIGNRSTGTLTISDTTFSGNSAGNGGAIDNLGTATVTNSTFSGNTAASSGGGIYNQGTLTVNNSTFSSNAGDGINNQSSLTVMSSTFSNNNGNGILSGIDLDVTNSSFSGNNSRGIYGGNGVLELTNSTFSNNGEGISWQGGLRLRNTIIANSTSGADCFSSFMLVNVRNLIEDGSCSPALSGDPMLDALASNGGPTQTMALQTGSPAIDQGDNLTCAAAPVNNLDQRGVTRPVDADTIPGAVCDIGAYEAPDTIAPGVTINQASGQADPTTTSPINFEVVFSEAVTGFGNSSGDVSLSGTAGATTAVATEVAPNDGTTYNVTVSGMTANGTVIASIPAGAATDAASNGNTASTSTDNTVTYVTSSPTTLLYNGGQVAGIGSSFQAAAKLSSPSAACVSGQTISFSLDVNPLNGSAGPYSLGSATTNSSGQASLSVPTTGWQEGIYIITASFGGTSSCDPSSDSATLTAAAPGNSATGGGWYTLSGSGRVNFGFNVRKVDNKCTTNCAYKGHLLLMNNGKWKLKGTLNTYVKSSSGVGTAGGVGDLYWWDASLNGGLGDWALAKAGVTYTISFYDGGSSKKVKTDTFGINIKYTPVLPQPSGLPNSGLTPLKGGDVKVQ